MRFASVVFDFDSTLVDAESFDLVCERALAERDDTEIVLDEIKRITTLGMEGMIPFGESLSRRMALVAPHRSYIQKVAEELEGRITRSFVSNLDFFTKHADHCYIVSGGFDELILPVARRLGIAEDHVCANRFLYDEKGNVCGIDTSRPTAHSGGKARALAVANVPRSIVVVGDGYTDAEVKIGGAADAFIAFVEHARREPVIAHADHVAASFDNVRMFLEKMPNEA